MLKWYRKYNIFVTLNASLDEMYHIVYRGKNLTFFFIISICQRASSLPLMFG